MNVVLVAPDAPESYTPLDDLQSFVAALEDAGLTVLQVAGPVVQKRIVAALRRGCDVFLWYGHGEAGRLLLPTGGGIGARWLSFILSDACVPMAVIAGCNSSNRPPADLLSAFSDELPAAGINTITMAGQVRVDAAQRYALAMLQELSAGRELRQAHQIGLEALRTSGLEAAAPQLFMAERKQNDIGMADNDNRIAGLEATLRTMDLKLDRMTDSMHDLDTRQRLLEAKVEQLSMTVSKMEASVQTLSSVGPDYSRSWLLVSGAAILIVLVLLIFITSRLV